MVKSHTLLKNHFPLLALTSSYKLSMYFTLERNEITYPCLHHLGPWRPLSQSHQLLLFQTKELWLSCSTCGTIWSFLLSIPELSLTLWYSEWEWSTRMVHNTHSVNKSWLLVRVPQEEGPFPPSNAFPDLRHRHYAVPHSSQLTFTSPPKSGQKFLSVTQSSRLHILKKKEDIILSKAFSYFTYQHLCYTGYNWAIINCSVRTLERKHRIHEP